MPVGSWDGIPPAWQGKEICLSMIADWIMKNYLTEKKESVSGDWKNWLERMLAEAKLFNYSTAALNGLEQMVYLSKKQRQIVFPMLIKPLMVFRNAMVRERTSGNDFCMTQLRGIKNYETKGWEPVTVYCTANTKSTKFINRMFLEAAVKYSTGENKFKGPFPVMTVVDDIGQMLKIKALREELHSLRETQKEYAHEYYLMGNECITKAHDANAAIRCFDKALNLNPNYVEAWVRKGVTLLDIGEDYDAQVCLNKAVKLSPKSFKARYNRGKCLLKLKYYDEAILDFQQAVSIKPKHAASHEYLAEGFRAIGEDELAQRHQDIADALRGGEDI